MVEIGRLESVCGRKATEGSNPSLSAIKRNPCYHKTGISFYDETGDENLKGDFKGEDCSPFRRTGTTVRKEGRY